MSVTRRIFTFPGRRNDTADAAVIACALPAGLIGAALAPDDAPSEPAEYVSQTWDQSVRRIDLNINNRRVRAIAIAPDSAIAECDIWLGGDAGELRKHRVSPGNPCLTSDGDDFAMVSIPESIPCLDGALDGDESGTVFWDADRTVGDGNDPAPGGFANVVGFPLKLELWQGEVLPMRTHRRAAMIAHAVFLHAAEVNNERSLVVCVAGRRKVSVIVDVLSGAGGVTVSCFAIGGMKDVGSTAVHADIAGHEIQLPLNTDGDTTLTVETATVIEMDALSRPLLRVKVASVSIANQEIQVHVRAED